MSLTLTDWLKKNENQEPIWIWQALEFTIAKRNSMWNLFRNEKNGFTQLNDISLHTKDYK